MAPPPIPAPADRSRWTLVRVVAIGLLVVFVAAIGTNAIAAGPNLPCASDASAECSGSPGAGGSIVPVATTGVRSSASDPPVTPIIVTPPPSVGPPPVVTFDEEFNGTRLDSSWSRNWPGFGQTTWSRPQASVANGLLTIKAVRSGSGWTSDLIDTADSFVQEYGTFSARIRIPVGVGLWPAFWLSQPPNGFGQRAEIDIMEVCWDATATSSGTTRLYNFVHRSDSTHALSAGYSVDDLAGAWHVYSLTWSKDRMSFYLDGVEISRLSDPTQVSSVPMAVALDLAVGGWCSQSDPSTPSPSVMQVDWVRVTK